MRRIDQEAAPKTMYSADIAALRDECTHLRRQLHRIPELGLQEHKTSAFIRRYLADLGIEAQPVAGTGVIARVQGALDGPVKALRSDIDALAIHEPDTCDFASTHAGYMHACGHDGHMAMLLCAARYAQEHRAQVRGQVLFIFQPCEEAVAGAQMIIDSGMLTPKPAYIVGLHMNPMFNQGTIGIAKGAFMAGASEFAIDIHGRASHGAIPHQGIDAIAAGAAFVSGAQAIIARNMPPEEPALLSIGKFCGGTTHNIIADHVQMEGTIRAYSDSLQQLLARRLQDHLRALESAWGVTTQMRLLADVPPTVNDADLAEHLLQLYWEDSVLVTERAMVAEDFSRYSQVAPCVLAWVGCRNEDKGYTAALHNERFGFDEEALLYGVELYRRIMLD